MCKISVSKKPGTTYEEQMEAACKMSDVSWLSAQLITYRCFATCVLSRCSRYPLVLSDSLEALRSAAEAERSKLHMTHLHIRLEGR